MEFSKVILSRHRLTIFQTFSSQNIKFIKINPLNYFILVVTCPWVSQVRFNKHVKLVGSTINFKHNIPQSQTSFKILYFFSLSLFLSSPRTCPVGGLLHHRKDITEIKFQDKELQEAPGHLNQGPSFEKKRKERKMKRKRPN